MYTVALWYGVFFWFNVGNNVIFDWKENKNLNFTQFPIRPKSKYQSVYIETILSHECVLFRKKTYFFCICQPESWRKKNAWTHNIATTVLYTQTRETNLFDFDQFSISLNLMSKSKDRHFPRYTGNFSVSIKLRPSRFVVCCLPNIITIHCFLLSTKPKRERSRCGTLQQWFMIKYKHKHTQYTYISSHNGIVFHIPC